MGTVYFDAGIAEFNYDSTALQLHMPPNGIVLTPISGPPGTLSDGLLWYDSALDKFRARQNGATVDVIGGGGSYTDEEARDAVAAMIAAGTHSGIAFVYNDAGDSISATTTITELVYNRIDGNGDIRIDGNGDLRISS